MHPVPILLLLLCLFGLAAIIIVVLALISVYIPDFVIPNLCQISFAPMISYAVGVGPMAIKIVDLNNDTFLDIVVASFNGSTTSIFLGKGEGSFEKKIDLFNGYNAGTNGIAIGDINKDNLLDIVVVNRETSTVGIFLGQDNKGNYSTQITFSTGIGSTPTGLALGDFNNDTFLDLIISDHENDRLLIFLGYGNTTFQRTLTLNTGNHSGPYLVVINDFNKDNRLDIAVGNGDIGGNFVSIYLGNGKGNFSSPEIYHIASGPYALVAADFDRNGILDIVTANYNGNSTTLLVGNSGGSFRQRKSISTGSGSLPYAIAAGDFNRDNIQDLIVANSGTNNVGILLGYGNGNFRNQRTYSTGNGSKPVDVAVGDLNGDNRLDFVSVNNDHNTIGIFLSTCS